MTTLVCHFRNPKSGCDEWGAEKEVVTHSSTLAWKFPWTEKTGGLSPWLSTRVGSKERVLRKELILSPP